MLHGPVVLVGDELLRNDDREHAHDVGVVEHLVQEHLEAKVNENEGDAVLQEEVALKEVPGHEKEKPELNWTTSHSRVSKRVRSIRTGRGAGSERYVERESEQGTLALQGLEADLINSNWSRHRQGSALESGRGVERKPGLDNLALQAPKSCLLNVCSETLFNHSTLVEI